MRKSVRGLKIGVVLWAFVFGLGQKANAQQRSCAERLAAAGFDPAHLVPGMGKTMEHRRVIIQLGDLPNTVCDRVDQEMAQEKSDQHGRLALEQQLATTKAELAQATSRSFVDYLYNHIIQIVCVASAAISALVWVWIGVFIGMKLRVR